LTACPSAGLKDSPGPAERASRFSCAFSPLFRVIEFVAYPKNSVVEIVGNHTEHAYFSSVVNMFADTGAGIIVDAAT
jgi:hypothetical protein